MDEAEPENPEKLLAWVDSRLGLSCAGCGACLCRLRLLESRAIAGEVPPRCTPCLARSLGRTSLELAGSVAGYIRRRDCYRRAWEILAQSAPAVPQPVSVPETTEQVSPGGGYFVPPEVQDEWNAGDLGCGDLLLPLRGRMRQMSPGQVLLLTASDASAPQDIPAWCALTGHRLEGMSHPCYWIRRRAE